MHVDTKGFELVTDDACRVVGIKTMTPKGPKIYSHGAAWF